MGSKFNLESALVSMACCKTFCKFIPQCHTYAMYFCRLMCHGVHPQCCKPTAYHTILLSDFHCTQPKAFQVQSVCNYRQWCRILSIHIHLRVWGSNRCTSCTVNLKKCMCTEHNPIISYIMCVVKSRMAKPVHLTRPMPFSTQVRRTVHH